MLTRPFIWWVKKPIPIAHTAKQNALVLQRRANNSCWNSKAMLRIRMKSCTHNIILENVFNQQVFQACGVSITLKMSNQTQGPNLGQSFQILKQSDGFVLSVPRWGYHYTPLWGVGGRHEKPWLVKQETLKNGSFQINSYLIEADTPLQRSASSITMSKSAAVNWDISLKLKYAALTVLSSSTFHWVNNLNYTERQ
jgi:hypothetical protein